MARRLLRTLSCLSLLAAGCGGGMSMGGDSMDPYVSSVSSEIDALAAELKAHKTAMAGATKLDEVLPLEDTHSSKIDVPIGDLKATCMTMRGCHDADGKAPDVATMRTLADQLEQECNNHRSAMAGAADLAAANKEEARHQTALTSLADQMMKQQTSLAPKAGDYTCGSMKM